jgi:DNA-binding NarL/FixJ family response regulator
MEDRVAQLAAQVTTNREIAHQLYLSVRTVETHLSAAYRMVSSMSFHVAL